jgi:hypothetical protein
MRFLMDVQPIRKRRILYGRLEWLITFEVIAEHEGLDCTSRYTVSHFPDLRAHANGCYSAEPETEWKFSATGDAGTIAAQQQPSWCRRQDFGHEAGLISCDIVRHSSAAFENVAYRALFLLRQYNYAERAGSDDRLRSSWQQPRRAIKMEFRVLRSSSSAPGTTSPECRWWSPSARRANKSAPSSVRA